MTHVHTPKQVSADELLPCPLCSAKMELEQFLDWGEQPLAHRHIVHPGPSTCPLVGVQVEATPEAIVAWNTRALTRRSSAGVKGEDGSKGSVPLSVYESVVKGRQDFRQAFRDARGLTETAVVQLFRDKFEASDLSFDKFGESVGLSGEFVRTVLNGTRRPSKAILALVGVEEATVYRLSDPQVEAWRCTKCACHSYARVDERKPDGSFGPGLQVRCVNCKDMSALPSHAGEDDEAVIEPALAYQRAEESICECGAAGSGEGHSDFCPWLDSSWKAWGDAFDAAPSVPPQGETSEAIGEGWEGKILGLMRKHFNDKTLGALTYEHGPYQITKVLNSVLTFAAAVRFDALTPSPTLEPREVERRGIYVASKVAHAEMWRDLRHFEQEPIISTWIDEAGVGESASLEDLWRRCVREASTAAALIIYRRPDEVLKGAWVELGAALASGVPVFAVGIEEFTVANHAGITHCADLVEARKLARAALIASRQPTSGERE